jgi:tRNA(His) guanylyltransferase
MSMDSEHFEARMRGQEYFHSLRLLPGTWCIVRVDGRSFSRLSETHFKKPFDAQFQDCMIAAARALLEEMQGLYAYVQSDEISVLFRPEWSLFDRCVEKILSISAGLASATFSLAAQQAAHFDSRIWMGVDTESIVDYFRWRQSDANRNALQNWCYWTLREEGMDSHRATQLLEGQSGTTKKELLAVRGIDVEALPDWQVHGVGLAWEVYTKTGFNPKRNEKVQTTRRRIQVLASLPRQEAYDSLLLHLVAAGELGPNCA